MYMRTFTQLITEREFESYRAGDNKYVEVFIDPTVDDIKEVAKSPMLGTPPEHPDGPTVWGRTAYLVRALLGKKNYYIWNYDIASHGSVQRHLGRLPNLPDPGSLLIPIYLYYYPASGTARFMLSEYSAPEMSPDDLRKMLARVRVIKKTFRTVLIADLHQPDDEY